MMVKIFTSHLYEKILAFRFRKPRWNHATRRVTVHCELFYEPYCWLRVARLTRSPSGLAHLSVGTIDLYLYSI